MTDLTLQQALQADREAVALTWLARLQLATAEQVSALAWRGLSRASVKARLGWIRRAGLLEFAAARTGSKRRVVLCRLTSAGALAAARLLADSQVTHGVRNAAAEGTHLEHRLRVNDLVIRLVDSLDQGAVEVLLPHQRRLRWQVAGGAWHEVTADAVLVAQGAQTALAIEYDRGLRGLDGIGMQLQRYREALEQPDLPSYVARMSIVYALHPPSSSRATAILRAAANAGLETRVAVVAAQDLADVVVDAIVRGHGPR